MTATATIEIQRPVTEVFDYVTDPARFHEWQNGVVDAKMTEPGPSAVGSHWTTTRRLGPLNRPFTSVVTTMSPPNSWAVQGIDGPIRALVDVSVEAVNETRARVGITVTFAGRGIGRVLVPLVRRQAAKEMPANMERLRHTLESTRPSQ
ncbi:hypothetical protein GCM10027449_30840 [Sinomonas notoginsengisoli]|uniref:SRPBCC family protein n=1 Tax=Sinomonas notoginsengisoli TaxID=1457311 RepID=UPI001F29D339|nr:SRPBCC family protein [Sinomonas notoginsengisoli]